MAGQLRISDVVQDGGALYAVTSVRVQGRPAEVCVELAGVLGRRHYPVTAPILVLRPARPVG